LKLALSDNRMQIGFGTFVIFLYALYGAHIWSLYIIQGDKGALRSEDFLLFVIVFLLLCLSNLGKLLITRTIKDGGKPIIIIFIIYLMFKLIFQDSETQYYYIGIIFSEIGNNFIVGFIAFSTLNSRMPILSTIMRWPQRPDGMKRLATIGIIIFIVSMLYFLTQFLDTSLLNILDIIFIPLSNDYYQDFGDYITIAYCCLASLQISYFNRNIFSDRKYFIFAFMLLVEALIACICLQAVNSNKSVLVIMLVSVLSIFFCKPKNWLIGFGRIKPKALIFIPIILIGVFLSSRLLQTIDLSRLNIFAYDENSSILAHSMLQSRWQLVRQSFMDQLSNSPVFGDISIKNYMHSSLLSVQTHLGIIGSLLLWSFIIIQLHHLFWHYGNECLKALSLSILFTSIISSFFSWGPLWFLIGALYAYPPQSSKLSHYSHKNSLRNNRKSSIELPILSAKAL
jgi:hypothetical protein